MQITRCDDDDDVPKLSTENVKQVNVYYIVFKEVLRSMKCASERQTSLFFIHHYRTISISRTSISLDLVITASNYFFSMLALIARIAFKFPSLTITILPTSLPSLPLSLLICSRLGMAYRTIAGPIVTQLTAYDILNAFVCLRLYDTKELSKAIAPVVSNGRL